MQANAQEERALSILIISVPSSGLDQHIRDAWCDDVTTVDECMETRAFSLNSNSDADNVPIADSGNTADRISFMDGQPLR